MKKLLYTAVLLILSTTSCKVGPTYSEPPIPCVENWKSSVPQCTEKPACDECTYWWEVFNDPFLDCLEMQAIENSPNVEIALQRLYEACATANANIPSLPYFFLDPSYNNNIKLIKIPAPTGGFANNGIFRYHQLEYLLPIRMNFEFDIWGRYRRQYDSYLYAAEAQRENYHAAILSLTSDVATNYFNLRALDAQIVLYEKTIEVFRESLSLTESRQLKGYVSLLDVNNATVQLNNTLSSLEEVKRTRTQFENTIATLIGTPASDFCIQAFPLTDTPPPCVPPNLPSEVLLQRPDIAAYERTAASEHEKVGYAYTSFFPSLSLTGVLGFSSPIIAEFTKWHSRYWQLGVESQETLFDAGRNCANLQGAWAHFQEASANYQQGVLVALQEVEDSLTSLEHQAKQYELLQFSAEAAKSSSRIATSRYSKGVSNYLDVLVAQNSELNADISLINTRGKQYISTIQLLKALGGCW